MTGGATVPVMNFLTLRMDCLAPFYCPVYAYVSDTKIKIA